MPEIKREIFSGLSILSAGEWLKKHAVVIENGLIKAIIPESMITHHLPAKEYVYPASYYLVPGFIDLHVHGVGGFDVMDGTKEAILAISLALAKEGVTGFLATTMTADKAAIEKVLTLIPSMQAEVAGAAILGIHLEGPFISPAKMGAQMHGKECLPDNKLMSSWLTLAKNTIKKVTLAPELPGALNLIKLLVTQGVIASIGHTNATYAETEEAIFAGCSEATHLFNAMRGLHQRDPGTVGAILLSREVSAEIIVDGEHLHPAIVELCFRLLGKDRLFLVTDAIRAKCMGEGHYELGGQTVAVKKGRAFLKNGVLAGSVLTMPEAIQNMTNFTQCDLADAFALASRNPAKSLGIYDRKGSIDIGKDADLVVLNEALNVKLTLSGGKTIFHNK